ncbi:beta-galactosidase [Paenibacillus sp. LS1]|uniref:beta-galactosidase n=1 Tax=Paenibacillus sp. LS1 TaxID=2992120 RepID=UPI002232BCDC|nr:beta-galactosidase [Paenibacillus sp. LS1]MCW3790235.1 beta-galactosidase [Paenibacillus sp. LS1]
MLKDQRRYEGNQFLLGVCYYPEHWNQNMWKDDFERMAEMGFNVVRMGETAWNIMEPSEGDYKFEMFDTAIELAAAAGLKVIMGTPTYAPPAWLTTKYPEVLRVDFRGVQMEHGSRRHYNYTSAEYLRLCEAIVTKMAEHYKTNDSIIGWQIDNELNCHSDVSFADSDHNVFRQWCKEKYKGDLNELNIAWGTAFWAQTYNSWEQICLPKPTVTYHSPSQLLDFYLFTSESTIRFAELQYNILKRTLPEEQFITHNGLFSNIDNYELTERTVDFMSYDSYPAFQLLRTDIKYPNKDRLSGKHLSRVRGLSAKFTVLEQQAGPGGQVGNVLNADRNDYLQATPKPGQMRLWTWQSIAHGADGILYFRWRTCPYGAESLWHGLNLYGNQPHWRLDEARRVAEETSKLEQIIINTDVEARAAIMYDYANDSNVKIERYTGYEYWNSEEQVYLSLSERHLGIDMLSKQNLNTVRDLSQYELLFYVNAQLLTVEDAEKLTAYVEQGGTLVLGPRSGYKDDRNQAYMTASPGVLQHLTGVHISDFTMLNPDEKNELCFNHKPAQTPSHVFNEILKPDYTRGVEVAATYQSDYYAGEPAVTIRKLGKGKVIYFGTFFTFESTNMLLDMLQIADPVMPWAEIPKSVEVITRKRAAGEYYILLNYAKEPATVQLKQAMTEEISDKLLEGKVVINPYDVWVLRA